MVTDIEIASAAEIWPITKVAENIGISEDDLELYGKYKAKLSFDDDARSLSFCAKSQNPASSANAPHTPLDSYVEIVAPNGSTKSPLNDTESLRVIQSGEDQSPNPWNPVQGHGASAEFLPKVGVRSDVDGATTTQSRHLILVTAINPTPAGEGKTTTSVGLTDALNRIGKRTVAALREPSLGPVFGVKGGAAGGGYAQVIPMEDINLHFTGDFHAIGAANNLLAALLDNHIKQGNELQINTSRIVWRRAVDMNDRQLRNIIDGLAGAATGNGTTANGVPREDGFDITVASEVMAVFCLATSLTDLKERLGRMVVAYNVAGEPVTATQIGGVGALTVLLKDAIKPNIVQTLEHNPVLIHGGPFANIAHGCNSVIATTTALSLAGDDGYVVTEAGFGADLGAEKFIDIKCRESGLAPDAVVIVATVRALKHNGGAAKSELCNEDLTSLEKGLPNLLQHVENIKNVFGLQAVVALNKFPTDTSAEVDFVAKKCAELGVNLVLSDVWANGGAGGEDLAREVVRLAQAEHSELKYAYELSDSIIDKLTAIAQKVYHADGAILTPAAKKQADELTAQGFAHLPICMAKTQYSFSDDQLKLGAPKDFDITVRKLKVNAGAGFIVAYTGDIMTMPGLPKVPAANNIDIDENGNVTGLF